MAKIKNIIFWISIILVLILIASIANIKDSANNINNLSFDNYQFPIDYYSYNDTILVINNNSQISKDIGNYFKSQRNINGSRIVYINTIDGEEINLSNFNNQIRKPIENFLTSNNLTNSTNYIITTKGLPLKITDIKRSVDSELTLILGPYNNSINDSTKIFNPYFSKNETFSRKKFGIYIVTRLTGYNYKDIKKMIDNSNKITNHGTFVIDVSSAKDGTTYQIYNDEMRNAASILKKEGYDVKLDNSSKFLTDQNDVLGYVSWGSNDPSSIDHAKPHNNWVPGAIAETAVSSSARTFNYPPSYGQSLIADLIAEGATGAKGYTYEPRLDAMARPEILFPRYTDGYNLADSYYMASLWIGWTDVVIGDPKTHIR